MVALSAEIFFQVTKTKALLKQLFTYTTPILTQKLQHTFEQDFISNYFLLINIL